MKVCYRLSDGIYCDNERSYFPNPPSDEVMINSGNVIGRHGGVFADYTCIETTADNPWLKKLIGGVLVPDQDKLDAIAIEEAAKSQLVNRLAELRQKLVGHTASQLEMGEYILLTTPQGS